MSTATATKSRSKKSAANPPEVISEVKLIPLDLIEVKEQIRKEFDQESIEQLAGDIMANGLMQPILVNPTPHNTYELIAGERRLRAVKHLGQSGIPALITKASADQILIMQLAENIQREELSFEDECAAIELLYKKLGKLAEVARVVKKSVSWVSKRTTVADKLDWLSRQILEEGVTEDMEILKGLEKYHYAAGYEEAKKLQEDIRQGKAGRTEVRALLKEAKAKIKAEEEKAAAKVSHAKPKKEPKPVHTWKCFAKHAITHELVEIDRRSSESEPDFWYEISKARKVGLDGEVWKNEEKVKEWFWNEEQPNEND